MQEIISRSISDAEKAVAQLKAPEGLAFIEGVALALAKALEVGGKAIAAGNGGSCCDAMHFAEELTGYFRTDRRALPAIALSDPGHLTCVSNDAGFEQVFARGIEAYGQPGDLFIGLTTSGNSPNLVAAFEAAKERGLVTVSFLGKGGGALKGVADHELIIDGFETSDRIQEAHMVALHTIIEVMERQLFDHATARSTLVASAPS
jgi:D-sedoheptulose 7-phosphate isomerase